MDGCISTNEEPTTKGHEQKRTDAGHRTARKRVEPSWSHHRLDSSGRLWGGSWQPRYGKKMWGFAAGK